MKTVILTAALAGTSLAWLPSCAWNDCMGSWDGSSCTQNSGWDCVCSNSTAIAQINTCVATSCTNATDQETIYGAIAQLCANAGKSVTNSQQATFHATSGGSLLPSVTGAGPGGNWNSGSWASWVSACSSAIGSAPSGWGPGASWGSNWGGPMRTGGPGGPGGWGPGGNGPWGTKASGIACSGTASWTTWTAGWGPFSSWTGVWSGCSSTTATPSPATVTTTITTDGHASVITGTTFGIQALSSGTSSASSTKATAGSAASHIDTSRALIACGGVAAAMLGLMIAL